jgi:hypothetical protein
VEKPEGNTPLGRPRHILEDNNNTGIKEQEWVNVEWIHLVQDKNMWRVLLNMVIKLQFQ